MLQDAAGQFEGLVYISQRAPGLDEGAIVDGIVLPAGLKNRRLDITGCLWFGRERFAQVLEGSGEAVGALYGEIERDSRHKDLRLVWRGPIAQRSFPRWGMKHIDGNDRDEIGQIVGTYLGSLGVTSVIGGETPVQVGSRLRRAFARLAPSV